MKNKFPAKEGWLRAKLTLKPGYTLTKEETMRICLTGNPEDYEVGEFKQLKNAVRFIFRKKPENQTA